MRALVLSGGGAHGAYQVGVLKHLLGDLKRVYDIYTGVSVGAINASFLSQFKTGEEEEAIGRLEEMWLSIDNSDIWRHRWIPYISALWSDSVYSTKPLHNLLETHLDTDLIKTSGKKLRIGMVSLTSGKYTVMDENHPDLATGVLASSAFPGFFETVHDGNDYYTDGGVREVTPLKDAIGIGADTVDIVLCSSTGDMKVVKGKFKTIGVLVRALNIMMDEVFENDLKVCALKNKVEGYRQIDLKTYRPNLGFKNNSLDFDPDCIREQIERGYKDAQGIK